MAKEKVCVFCGEPLSLLRSTQVFVSSTVQNCCKTCARELEGLPDEEKCRRALKLGLAESSKSIEEHLTLVAEAEGARPSCLRCGTKLKFRPMETLDNTPRRDSVFAGTFNVLPACCPSCGKLEFYDPSLVAQNRLLHFLYAKDTGG